MKHAVKIRKFLQCYTSCLSKSAIHDIYGKTPIFRAIHNLTIEDMKYIQNLRDLQDTSNFVDSYKKLNHLSGSSKEGKQEHSRGSWFYTMDTLQRMLNNIELDETPNDRR